MGGGPPRRVHAARRRRPLALRAVRRRATACPRRRDEPVDAAVRLEVNRWNGAVEPRLVLRHARPRRPGPIDVIGEPDVRRRRRGRARARPRHVATALAVDAASPAPAPATRAAAGSPACSPTSSPPASRCSRSSRTRRTARARCRAGSAASRSARGRRSRTTPSWRAASRTSSPSTRRPTRLRSALLERPSAPAIAHLAWGEPELRFAQRIHQWDFALRDPLTALYRALRGPGAGPRGGPRGRAPGRGAATEVGRARGAPGAGPLGARSRRSSIATGRPSGSPRRPARTALERSAAFRAYHRRLEDGLRYLTSDTIQRQAA